MINLQFLTPCWTAASARNPDSTTKCKTWIYRQNYNQRRTWDQKELVIAPNDCPCSYNIPRKKGNLISRNHCHLIPSSEKFNMKHDNEPTYRNNITKNCRIAENWQNFGTLSHHQSEWNSNKIPTVYFNMTRFFTFQIVSSYWHHRFFTPLTLAWRRSLWYRN